MMDNQNFVPDNIPADLNKSWHIPRPTLARSTKSSQSSTSSKNSTQSGRSGSLLLTASNLAEIHNHHHDHNQNDVLLGGTSIRDQNIQYYLEQTCQNNEFLASIPKTPKTNNDDNVSIASSMHFTVVNMNTKPNVPKRSYCRKHQLTILITTMTVFFLIGILIAILTLEMRAKNQRQ